MADCAKAAGTDPSRPPTVRFAAGNASAAPISKAPSQGTVHPPQSRDPSSSRARSGSRGRSRSRRPRQELDERKGPLHKSELRSPDKHLPGGSRGNRADTGEGRRDPNLAARSGNSPGIARQPPVRSWAAVASSATRGYTLSYFPPAVRNDRAEVDITDEVMDAADPKWADCLVGYFIGKKLPFKLVETALKQAWGNHLAQVLANDEGFFFFHIPDADFRRSVLDSGCFTVAKVPLILQQYSANVDLQRAKHIAIPIWVRLRNVPYPLWSSLGISVIASAIGRPLYVDSRTEKMSMISFARVCVEVQGGVALPDTVHINIQNETREVKVEYEWRPSFCPTCSTFGHKCPAPPAPSPEVDIPIPSVDDQQLAQPSQNEEGWHVVGARKSPRSSTRKNAVSPAQVVTDAPPAARHSELHKNKHVIDPTVTSSVSEEEDTGDTEDRLQKTYDEDVNLSVVPSTIPEGIGPSPAAPNTRKRGKKQEQPENSSTDTPRMRVSTKKPPKGGKGK